MVTSTAATPEEYLAELPEERREIVAAVRDAIRGNLRPGFAEGMSHGMIAWYVPLERFAATYNGEPLGLAALASQKGHVSLYLNDVYSDRSAEAWFRDRWAATGKKLDMGKSCVRFRRLEDVPLDVVGEAIRRTELDDFIDRYREARGSAPATRATSTD
jgi:hypothetical protein